MFAPDGWVYRARIGLLVPNGDVGPESEFSAMVSGRPHRAGGIKRADDE